MRHILRLSFILFFGIPAFAASPERLTRGQSMVFCIEGGADFGSAVRLMNYELFRSTISDGIHSVDAPFSTSAPSEIRLGVGLHLCVTLTKL